MSPIFIDANVPMYAAGRPHDLRQPCIDVLSLAARQPETFFTDVEILQELMHRYLALRRWAEGRVALREFASLMMGRVEPVYADDIEQAASLADDYTGLSARDLLHAAVMARVGADRIVSADHGFDRVRHLRRLDPADVATWGAQIEAT
jgi:uncharacterized protein